MTNTLVCFLEEPSAMNLLKGILPRLLPPGMNVCYHVFKGKQHLDKNIGRRLRNYCLPGARFLVMRDQDAGDCKNVKQQLQTIVNTTGKSAATKIRIACHELETFYLGDLPAVESALLLKNIARQQNTAKYRAPDTMPNPSELLKNLTSSKYQKIAGSRAIAPHLKLDGSNRSTSFNNLVDGIRRLVSTPATTRSPQ